MLFLKNSCFLSQSCVFWNLAHGFWMLQVGNTTGLKDMHLLYSMAEKGSAIFGLHMQRHHIIERGFTHLFSLCSYTWTRAFNVRLHQEELTSGKQFRGNQLQPQCGAGTEWWGQIKICVVWLSEDFSGVCKEGDGNESTLQIFGWRAMEGEIWGQWLKIRINGGFSQCGRLYVILGTSTWWSDTLSYCVMGHNTGRRIGPME